MQAAKRHKGDIEYESMHDPQEGIYEMKENMGQGKRMNAGQEGCCAADGIEINAGQESCCASDSAGMNAGQEGCRASDGIEMNAGQEGCCMTHKMKERTQQEYKRLIHRLNRIEGQVRGIRKMVEKDAYCTDILVQVAAVNAALNSFNKELLANHIKTCVTRDIRDGKEETVDELLAVLQKLMK